MTHCRREGFTFTDTACDRTAKPAGLVSNVASAGVGDVGDRVSEGHQSGAGQLVHLAGVLVLDERGDGGRDVVGVDEGFQDVADRQRESPARMAWSQSVSLRFCANQLHRTTVHSAPDFLSRSSLSTAPVPP